MSSSTVGTSTYPGTHDQLDSQNAHPVIPVPSSRRRSASTPIADEKALLKPINSITQPTDSRGRRVARKPPSPPYAAPAVTPRSSCSTSGREVPSTVRSTATTSASATHNRPLAAAAAVIILVLMVRLIFPARASRGSGFDVPARARDIEQMPAGRTPPESWRHQPTHLGEPHERDPHGRRRPGPEVHPVRSGASPRSSTSPPSARGCGGGLTAGAGGAVRTRPDRDAAA